MISIIQIMDGQIQPYKVTWKSFEDYQELIGYGHTRNRTGIKNNVKCFKNKAKAVAYARNLIKAFKVLNYDTKHAVKVEKLNTED